MNALWVVIDSVSMVLDDDLKNELAHLRQKIDEIDLALLDKINHRVCLAQKIGKLKGQEQDLVYKPNREIEVIRRLEDYLRNSKKQVALPLESIKFIYSEIISVCRLIQNKTVVGYLGPEGSFSNLASLRQFGHSADLVPLRNLESIFEKIEKTEIDYGVIPIENSIEGMVNHSIDLFNQYDVFIGAELFLNIHLNLFSREKNLSDIKKIYSHSQPFAQSRNWLGKNFPQATLIHTSSTSEAAKKILNQKETACIASKQISLIYPQLNLLAEKIEDQVNNMTRFAVVGNKKILNPKVEPNNVTSLIITIKDKSGALYEILSILAKKKINLTNLVSRPSKRKIFDYLFYLDFIGHPEEKRIKQVLKGMKKHVVTCQLIGTYPRGITYH